MSIDTEKMIEMAQARTNWETNEIAYKQEGGSYEVVWYQNGDQECGVGRVYELDDARFMAQSPATILALHQQVQDLQAANAALQARVGAWQGVDVVPPTEFQNTNNGREVINSEEVDVLVRVRAFRQELRFHDGGVLIEWVSHRHNTAFPHDRVLGWRYRPDESPTAAVVAESESEEPDCPVCNDTGWIQEGWGDYHMDGIPCSACEEREGE